MTWWRRRSLMAGVVLWALAGTGASGQMPKRESRALPSFVEMMPGAKQITDSFFSNDLRSGGTVLVSVEQPAAAILSFYRASMQKHGLTPGQETTTPKNVILLKGLSGDGKRELRLEVNPSKTNKFMIQLNYVVGK